MPAVCEITVQVKRLSTGLSLLGESSHVEKFPSSLTAAYPAVAIVTLTVSSKGEKLVKSRFYPVMNGMFLGLI